MVHPKRHRNGHQRRPQHPHAGVQHLPRIQRPNTAFQQVGTDASAGNESTAVGHTQQNHHRLRIGCHGDRQARQNNLRGGDGDDDEGGRPGLLAGVEDA